MSLEFSLDVVLVGETIPVGVTPRPSCSEYEALVAGASLFSEVETTAGASLIAGVVLTTGASLVSGLVLTAGVVLIAGASLVAGVVLGTSLVVGTVLAISSAYTFEDD